MSGKILSLIVFLAVLSDASSTLEIAFVLHPDPDPLSINNSTSTLAPINITTTGPPPPENTTTPTIVTPTTTNANASTEPTVTTNSTTTTEPTTTANFTTASKPPITENGTTTVEPLTTNNTTTATWPPTNTTTATWPPTNTTTATWPPTTTNTTTTTWPPTTTAPETTSVRPVTTAKPVADYSVEENGTVCIRVRGVITFQVPYTSNKAKAVATISVPADGGTVVGQCFEKNGTSAFIHIIWGSETCVFVLGFELHSDGSWKTVYMNYTFETDNPAFISPDKIESITGALLNASDAEMYRAASNKSYACDREDTIKLSNGVFVKFSHFQMQPIKFYGTDFSKADFCAAPSDNSTTSSVVPIAVGCALAGLIVIVLVAYLIGRRRSNRGYQHV